MVTRKPVPVTSNPPLQTLPLSTLTTPPDFGNSPDNSNLPDGASLESRNLTNPLPYTSENTNWFRNGSKANQEIHNQELPSDHNMRDRTSSPTNREQTRRSTFRNVGSSQVTPKSSWESVSAEEIVHASQVDHRPPSLSPPAKSTNPFRRSSSPTDTSADKFAGSGEGPLNPWSNEPGHTPLNIQSTSGPGNYSSTPIQASSSNATAPRAAGSTASTTKWEPEVTSTYDHGLEQLIAPVNTYLQLDRNETRDYAISEAVSRGKEPASQNQSPTSNGQFDPKPEGIVQFQSKPNTKPQRTDGSNNESYIPGTSGTSLDPLPQPSPHPEKIQNEKQSESNSEPIQTPPPQQKSKRPSETYQIRLVNWFDASSTTNPRRSPIMVQNANGPCPLLALVNALVLSTPSTVTTALVETLRVREQVSLGLLLDAVIDELMSGRRGDAAQNLPDVSDLYAFLVNLHTGMNVNPCFVSAGEDANLMDAPVDAPSTAHDFRKPGGFEETREMRLYSTFAVPLIHGWIPSRTHPAFAALKRRAKTYEDAQNLMFREEELEEKLKQLGLNQEEQQILEDIGSVKYFLSSTATQLTGYGLDTMTETLKPGSLAILFRNDHFSTLYRHPRSGQLLTLVTDMGYAGHDEVVWESLVDVSGEGCEFYSGDFRPVGGFATEPRPSTGSGPVNDNGGWTTVANRSRRTTQSEQRNAARSPPSPLPSTKDSNTQETNPSPSPNFEQEDHDLALAMQLQEEEEERERQETAARRREDELSQAYLNNADAQGRRTFPGFARGARNAPNVPPRGGSNPQQNSSTRQGARRDTSSDDAPPPSYEQAAKGPAYHPPQDHPSHPQSSGGGGAAKPLPQQPRRHRGSSAYSEHAASFGGSPSTHGVPRSGPLSRGRGSALESTPSNRRRGGAPISAGADEERKDKDCRIM